MPNQLRGSNTVQMVGVLCTLLHTFPQAYRVLRELERRRICDAVSGMFLFFDADLALRACFCAFACVATGGPGAVVVGCVVFGLGRTNRVAIKESTAGGGGAALGTVPALAVLALMVAPAQ